MKSFKKQSLQSIGVSESDSNKRVQDVDMCERDGESNLTRDDYLLLRDYSFVACCEIIFFNQ